MKDLKHYFTDTVKARESSNESKEVTKNAAIPEESEQQPKATTPTMASAKMKRGRVKIKVTKNKAQDTVCDAVESKNDLIDKISSPFGVHDVKGDKIARNDTPEESPTRKSTIISPVANKKTCMQSKNKGKNPDENDNKISAVDVKVNESTCVNGRDIFVEDTGNVEISIGEREESNAFQVLMTRKKLVQYNVAAPLTLQEEEVAAKVAEDNRRKLKRNKEKLIALADKKGYSKRKLDELEEAEKIERRFEKRVKVFKQMGNDDNEEKNVGRRVSPTSLHNYFSKVAPEENKKELTAVSTLAAQAEVLDETREVKMATEMNVKVPATVDDIEVIEIKDLSSSGILPQRAQTNRRCSTKPRWSLRINLACNDEKVEADYQNGNGDKTTREKRELKHRKSKAKVTNYEENLDSDLEVLNVTRSKNKKHASNVRKKKSVTKVDAQSEALPIVPDILPAGKAEIPILSEPRIVQVKVDKHRTTEKLAPLFVKRLKQDPAVLEARRLFLHPVPTEYDNPRTKCKAPIVGVPLLPFPTISHVTQLDVESTIETTYLKSKFHTREKCSFTPSFNPNEFKSVTSLKNDTLKNSNDSVEMSKENLEQVLVDIESRCSDAREIWKRISKTVNDEETPRTSPKRRSKKQKSNEKKGEISNAKTSHAGTWTQKYRPLSTQEIVGNEDAGEKLRKWLSGWKAPLRKEDNSSGDEFYSSDCSFASNFDNNQVAVLLGPHGSGKTASVYAVAEELGYSILEINASSKRAGKKILKELEEATKSHRIRKDDAMSLAPFVRNKKAISKNSLILIEDIDLIFEEDEGFISATCQLTTNTKRPIVMTGRDTCSHLYKMAPQQHRIYYQTTVGSRVSALLELIALAESGYRLPRPCLDRLLRNGDLRKALLQLQYLLLSGKPRASEVPTDFHQSLWQDMRYCIYKPAVKSTKKSLKKKLADGKKITVKNGETSLAKDLESLSFLSTLIEIEDPALELSTLKLEPSLSLDERMHAYSSMNNTSAEIARWLRDRTMTGKEATDFGDDGGKILRQLSLKKELNLGVNFALSQVSPYTLDSRVLAIDYLPSVRTICRAEEVRISTNGKRGNRFFHYLQNLKVPYTSTRPNILAAACKMLREKNTSES